MESSTCPEERARLAKEQAVAQEMKNAQMRSELIPAANREADSSGLWHPEEELAIPTKIAPETEAASCETILREHLEDALHELAKAEIVSVRKLRELEGSHL